MASTSKRRRVIKSECRQIIANVYYYLKEEYKFTELHREPNTDISHMRNISKRTALATGVGVRTVQTILREEREMCKKKKENGSTSPPRLISPMRKRKKRKNKVDIDEHTADIIRSTIQDFQIEENQNLTLTKLRSVLNEKIGFDGCLATLSKLLHKLGYKWRRAGNKVLVEQHILQDKSEDITIKQEETSSEEETSSVEESSYESD